MTLPITTILTSLLAIWLLVLSKKIIDQRGVAKTPLGDGGDDMLLRRIRAQANLVEYAPFMIALVALAESQGANSWIVGILAAVFLLGRIAHGYALSFTAHNPKGRFYGTAATWTCIALMALHNLAMFLF